MSSSASSESIASGSSPPDGVAIFSHQTPRPAQREGLGEWLNLLASSSDEAIAELLGNMSGLTSLTGAADAADAAIVGTLGAAAASIDVSDDTRS